MSLEDDSLEGSIVVQENPIIKESESKYKSGAEHRFLRNPESRFLSDKPLLVLFNKNNKWRSVTDIVKETGMAERTIHYACKRFTKHEIFEEMNCITSGSYGNHRTTRKNARLYRLITKDKNDTRRNTRKNEAPKK